MPVPPDWIFWAVAGLWACFTLACVRTAFAMRTLPPLHPRNGDAPRVTAVLAARDEEARIEETVRGLLAQEGVALELVAVDDRSADRTGDILRRIAAEAPRLQPLRVEALPDGWLGKCHACHLGAGRATGEWLLFTDGDVWLRPDVAARAVQQAEAAGADHVTLMPGVPGATLMGSATLMLIGLGLGGRAERVNRDVKGAHLGVGAFNLVRAETYRAFGGHLPLRMEVVDDLKLGLLVRRAGKRSRVYFATGDADVDWCPDALGMVRGMEKNHFASVGYRTWRAVAGAAVVGLMWVPAVVGPFTGTLAGAAAGLGLLSLIAPALVSAVRLGRPFGAAFLVPLFVPMLGLSLVNSTAKTLWRGGVQWRDTFYPLAALRAGSVR